MASCTTGGFERSLRIAVRGGWLTKTSSTSGARSAGPLLSVSASRPLLLLWSQLCGPWVGSLLHSALGSKLRRHRPWNAGLSRRPLGLSALCRLWSVWNAVWRCSSWLPSRRTNLCRTPTIFSSGGVQMQGLAVAGTMCEGAKQRARTGSQCCLRTHRLPSCATSLVLPLAAWRGRSPPLRAQRPHPLLTTTRRLGCLVAGLL